MTYIKFYLSNYWLVLVFSIVSVVGVSLLVDLTEFYIWFGIVTGINIFTAVGAYISYKKTFRKMNITLTEFDKRFNRN